MMHVVFLVIYVQNGESSDAVENAMLAMPKIPHDGPSSDARCAPMSKM